LLLKAVASSDDGKGLKPDAALRGQIVAMLGDAKASRAQMDVLVNGADDLARALAPEAGPDRQQVVAALNRALERLQADGTLSRADRLSALLARVELARLDAPRQALRPPLDGGLKAQVRSVSSRLDREVTDTYERQAVITLAAHVLGRAGLWDDSNALLKAGLARSHAPYYLMSQLGGNARKLGDKTEALAWYEKAWQRSEGPATRLQWGSGYVSALTELAPEDEGRIEQAVAQLFDEAGSDRAAFHERSARSLQRVGRKLKAWNETGDHDAVLERLRARLAPLCGRLEAADPQRKACLSVMGT
jgi:hypothetical protein